MMGLEAVEPALEALPTDVTGVRAPVDVTRSRSENPFGSGRSVHCGLDIREDEVTLA